VILSAATTVKTIDSIPLYFGIAVGLALLAVALVAVPLILSSRTPRAAQPNSRHSINRSPERWRDDVAAVLRSYQDGTLNENDAYSELARIARSFASLRLGTDLTSKTLLDLKRHRQVGSRAHFDALKQTISALYPAEFANAASNAAARETTVESAANWVDSMIERWVS
jgi:hypothetical protein